MEGRQLGNRVQRTLLIFLDVTVPWHMVQALQLPPVEGVRSRGRGLYDSRSFRGYTNDESISHISDPSNSTTAVHDRGNILDAHPRD